MAFRRERDCARGLADFSSGWALTELRHDLFPSFVPAKLDPCFQETRPPAGSSRHRLTLPVSVVQVCALNWTQGLTLRDHAVGNLPQGGSRLRSKARGPDGTSRPTLPSYLTPRAPASLMSFALSAEQAPPCSISKEEEARPAQEHGDRFRHRRRRG